MNLPDATDAAIHLLAVAIEFAGGIVAVYGCGRGVWALMRSGGSNAGILAARLLIADAIIAALSFKTAATLLKTIELRSWNAIVLFAVVLALRIFVKWVLMWEEGQLRSQER